MPDEASTQLPLGLRLRDSSVFASYLPGRNALAVDTLQQLKPEAHRPAIWLYGPRGTGKTHLLQAQCARAGRRGESAAYFPLAGGHTLHPGILEGCGGLTWVCIDDISAVAGSDAWERTLFGLYTELEDRGGRLVVTAASAPAVAGFRLPDLASRLVAATVLRLSPLDEAEQIEALRLRASQRGFDLPEETARYLLTRLPRDMHSLCAFLDQLDVASLVAQRRLTVPFVGSVLKRTEPDS